MLLGISASIFVSDQDRTLRESIDLPIPAMATVFVPWVAPNSLPLITRQLPGGAEVGDRLVIRAAAHATVARTKRISTLEQIVSRSLLMDVPPQDTNSTSTHFHCLTGA
jgi:hypothetical protein